MPADGGGTTVSFVLGNGDGTFQPHADFTVGFAPNQVAVGGRRIIQLKAQLQF